jgi:hypothetical protein
MSTEQPTTHPTFDELDALDTEDLRERAFHLAWEKKDFGFFISVIRQLPASVDAEDIDGSFGAVGASLADIVSLWHEMKGHDYGSAEPLVRAAFIDYLMKH